MRFLAALFFLLAFQPSLAHAQTLEGSVPLSIIVTPERPRPYETVTITAQSSLINLAASTITITANGAALPKDAGSASASYKLGGPGSRTTVRVSVSYNGTPYEASRVIIPADVALVVEADSTTHPFYKGAALVAPEGALRIIAIADLRTAGGTRIPSQQLSYLWQIGDRTLSEQSGIGRSVLSATAPTRYRDSDVTVTVSSTDGTVAGQARVSITPANPLVIAYPFDPLLGTDFANAITDIFTMSGEETSFRAVPFFFANTPQIAWTLNSVAAGQESELTVRTTGETAGNALAGVAATSAFGEFADESFTVMFGANRRSNIFGF